MVAVAGGMGTILLPRALELAADLNRSRPMARDPPSAFEDSVYKDGGPSWHRDDVENHEPDPH
ncbi:hypothetical protein V2J09_006612 [Rumex salicifolius]